MTRLSWISWRLWSLRAEPSSFERKGELQMWSEVFCLTCFDHRMPLMAVVHFFGEKIALLVMRMLRSSLSSSRSIHSRASSHSLIVVIDVGFLTLPMVRSFSGGGCVSDAPPFARLALYMEKCGCFFWKMRNAWWEWHWRFGGHGVGYAASGLAGVASACRLRPGGRCGKCLVFEMLAVLARPRCRDA